MPEMTGLELAAYMADHWPAVPILLISGQGGPPSGYPGAFVAKPFTWDVLLDAVGGLVPLPNAEARERYFRAFVQYAPSTLRLRPPRAITFEPVHTPTATPTPIASAARTKRATSSGTAKRSQASKVTPAAASIAIRAPLVGQSRLVSPAPYW